MPLPPRLLSAALALSLGLAVHHAAAQTAPVLTLATTGINRPNSPARDLKNDEINYADCLSDDLVRITLGTSGTLTSLTLEVWAGSDCAATESRSATGGCWKVYQDDTPSSEAFDIKVRDIIAQNVPGDAPNGPGSGVEADCENNSAYETPKTTTLNFLLVSSGNNTLPTGFMALTHNFTIDLVGPNPPTDLSAGIGEESLIIDFKEGDNAAEFLKGYNVYCDPPPGSTATSASALAGGASGVAGAAGAAGADAAAGASAGGTSGTGGNAGTSGTGGNAGTAASAGFAGDPSTSAQGGASNCPSTVLVAGQQPSSDYLCGSADTNSESVQTDTTLTNGQEHTVAIAAVDTFGNPGKLSVVACGTPEPVTGFYEAYRASGGKGGGGFCAISAPARSSLPWVSGIAALFAASALRRRNRPGRWS